LGGAVLPYSRLRLTLPDVVARIERTYAYGAVLLVDSEDLVVDVDRSQERIEREGPRRGVVLTGFDGREVREVATVDLTPDGLFRAAGDLAAMAQPGAGRWWGLGPRPGETRGEDAAAQSEFSTLGAVDPAGISLREKLDLCRSHVRRGLGLDRRCFNAVATYHEQRQHKIFANRKGTMAQTITRVNCGCGVYIADGGPPRGDFIFQGGTGGYELVELPERDWEELGETLRALLRAKRLTPGFYDIIASPAVSGLIAHESFGHGVEMDMFLKNRARSREYLGRAVGSPVVNLYDDAAYPGGYGSHFFDDEGQPAGRVEILKAGVFEGGMSDLYSATRLGLPRTSNGRRESFSRKAYARMTNTFFGPGADRFEDMLASIDRGVYLGRTLSGMEDPKGWGIQCEIAWGREIRKGRFTGRYWSPIGLTGFVPDLLSSISLVGGQVELESGYCGKGFKETLAVASGGPYIKARARLS
jgi:TldD protein